MPLSVPLLLVPGEPERYYTVHLHRVRSDADAGPLTGYHLTELEVKAQRGLRMVFECIAAGLEAAVEVTENSDGSAEAVARVLCTEDECAAVAEHYRRDADEDVEAEAARAWAATQLLGQAVQLLKLRGELEKTMPYATWARTSGEKPFTSVTAAAKWVAAELDAAAVEEQAAASGHGGTDGAG